MWLQISYKKKKKKKIFEPLSHWRKEFDPDPHQNVTDPQNCFIPLFIISVVKSFNLRSKEMKLTWRLREEPAWIWWWRDSPATRRRRGGYPVQNRANQSTKQRKPFQKNKDQLFMGWSWKDVHSPVLADSGVPRGDAQDARASPPPPLVESGSNNI